MEQKQRGCVDLTDPMLHNFQTHGAYVQRYKTRPPQPPVLAAHETARSAHRAVKRPDGNLNQIANHPDACDWCQGRLLERRFPHCGHRVCKVCGVARPVCPLCTWNLS